MDSDVLTAYPKLIAFHQRFTDIPEIKEFIKSDKYKKVWLPSEATWTRESQNVSTKRKI